MLTDLLSIGFRPALAGTVVLLIGAVTGWGLAARSSLAVVTVVRFWVERVLLRALRHRSWALRAAVIFVNNASICALLILVGGRPAGSWLAITAVGLSMGIAIRTLTEGPDALGRYVPDAGPDEPSGSDPLVWCGLLVNLVEVPAIIVTLGLSMGQLAAPNGLAAASVWRIFLVWVTPALLAAAGGESLWIGRRRPFRSPH